MTEMEQRAAQMLQIPSPLSPGSKNKRLPGHF